MPTNSNAAQQITALEARLQQLVDRLQRGEAMIRDAASPGMAKRYERYWLQLLEEYERVSDEIAHLRGEGVSPSPSD